MHGKKKQEQIDSMVKSLGDCIRCAYDRINPVVDMNDYLKYGSCRSKILIV